MGIKLCRRGMDEVVRVGAGGSAFWIDRYEASVWQNTDGTGTQYFRSDGDFPAATFPRNGQATAPLYAVSRTGVMLARWITWFQALEACRASGKRLPTGDEWLAAGRGTVDPGASNGDMGRCNTMSGGPRTTGGGTACVSAWGAQDLIGNLWEWTVEWFAGVGDGTQSATPWPDGYNGDGTWNIASSAWSNGIRPGVPAAAHRGGRSSNGTLAGLYALDLSSAPSHQGWDTGFRCVVAR
jgi:formylglycine-generating enzyme required for sulfatase activity